MRQLSRRTAPVDLNFCLSRATQANGNAFAISLIGVTHGAVVPMSHRPCPSVTYLRLAHRLTLRNHTIILGTNRGTLIRTATSFAHPSVSYLTLLCILCFISGCDAVHGGGSPTAQPSSIAITPATARIRAGDTQVFVMTARLRSLSGVTWLVNGIPGGNATLGTIDAKGLYTAPPAPPRPNLVRRNGD